jgi:hypothetical protein
MGSLASAAAQVERMSEFHSDRDIREYAKLIRRMSQELHLRVGMDADVIQATLSEYKGKWYTFGLQSKVKARIVAAHLKVGAEASKLLGVSAVRMAAAFEKHFVQPEHDARRRASSGGRGKFEVT